MAQRPAARDAAVPVFRWHFVACQLAFTHAAVPSALLCPAHTCSTFGHARPRPASQPTLPFSTSMSICRLVKMPTTEVLMMGFFPRNTPACGCFNQPSIFTKSINTVNEKLK